MAKTYTADSNTPAPAKAVVAAPPARSAPVASQEFTEAQRSPESFLADATALFGADPPKALKPAAKEEKPVVSKPDKTEKEAPKAKEEEKEAAPEDEALTIPDDEDAPTVADDKDEDTEKGRIAKAEFEKRELKRQHKDEIKALEAKMSALEASVKNADTSSIEADGFFKGVKTPKDVDDGLKLLEGYEAFYEDNEDGYTGQDGTEYDRKAVKQSLRAVRAEMKKVPDLKKAFADLDSRKETANAKAKKLFPWASDPDSKHHQTVLDLAKAHPEIAKAPDSAYLLPLMAMGKMVESGKYKLVLSSPAAAKDAKAEVAKPTKAVTETPPVRKPLPREETDDTVGFTSTSSTALDLALSVFA